MVQRMPTNMEKTEKLHEIDHTPKCKQQPRSTGGPKRRTDFSTFFCSPSSSSSVSTGPLGKGPEEMRQNRKNVQIFPIVRCSSFQDRHQGLLSNIVDVPVVRVESSDQNSPSETLSARTVREEESDIVRKLEFTPTNSQVTEGSNLSMSPGSVVWAKRAHQLWWPAEILGERSTAVDSKDHDVEGHVLIQYYGNHESVWVDPALHLSNFDENFEERSCHSGEEFQDALKHALWQKECGSSEKQCIGSSDYLNYSNQQDQSPDKCNSSSSSRAESDYLVRRSKRERKPNLRFDVACPLTPVKKARRLRIMRFLGLAAPAGSPF